MRRGRARRARGSWVGVGSAYLQDREDIAVLFIAFVYMLASTVHGLPSWKDDDRAMCHTEWNKLLQILKARKRVARKQEKKETGPSNHLHIKLPALEQRTLTPQSRSSRLQSTKPRIKTSQGRGLCPSSSDTSIPRERVKKPFVSCFCLREDRLVMMRRWGLARDGRR